MISCHLRIKSPFPRCHQPRVVSEYTGRGRDVEVASIKRGALASSYMTVWKQAGRKQKMWLTGSLSEINFAHSSTCLSFIDTDTSESRAGVRRSGGGGCYLIHDVHKNFTAGYIRWTNSFSSNVSLECVPLLNYDI